MIELEIAALDAAAPLQRTSIIDDQGSSRNLGNTEAGFGAAFFAPPRASSARVGTASGCEPVSSVPDSPQRRLLGRRSVAELSASRPTSTYAPSVRSTHRRRVWDGRRRRPPGAGLLSHHRRASAR